MCVCIYIHTYIHTYVFKEHEKIKEYIYKCSGISGNGQRNFALTKITNENTLLYYLDDDNVFIQIYIIY
jgi:hypothetical protein